MFFTAIFLSFINDYCLSFILRLSILLFKFMFIVSLLFSLLDTTLCSIWILELFFLIVACYIISSNCDLLPLFIWLSINILDELLTFIILFDCCIFIYFILFTYLLFYMKVFYFSLYTNLKKSLIFYLLRIDIKINLKLKVKIK